MEHATLSWQSAGGLPIFAQEWRPAGAPRAAVALLHGLGEHSGRYAHVAQALTQAGYALLAMDLPGHGQSGGKRGVGGYDVLLPEVDLLLAETRKRFPGLPVFLYGHSLGGTLALNTLLMRQPDLTGAIVTSPGLGVAQKVTLARRLAARALANLAPRFTLDSGLDVASISSDPAVVAAYRQDALVHPMISTRLGLDILTRGIWTIQHAGDLRVPLLLMHGCDDRIAAPQASAAFAAAAPADLVTHIEWPGLYHEIHNEPQQAEVLQAMVDWLDRHC